MVSELKIDPFGFRALQFSVCPRRFARDKPSLQTVGFSAKKGSQTSPRTGALAIVAFLRLENIISQMSRADYLDKAHEKVLHQIKLTLSSVPHDFERFAFCWFLRHIH